MNSSFFRLNFGDFARGAAVAAIVAFLGGLEQALTAHGFVFAAYDWAPIANLACTAFIGYLSKNLLSTDNGKVFGKIGYWRSLDHRLHALAPL